MVSWGQRDVRDAQQADEAQEANKGSVFERTWAAKYGGRWRDLIGQLEYGLEVLIGWEPHAHTHERANGLSRTFCYEGFN